MLVLEPTGVIDLVYCYVGQESPMQPSPTAAVCVADATAGAAASAVPEPKASRLPQAVQLSAWKPSTCSEHPRSITCATADGISAQGVGAVGDTCGPALKVCRMCGVPKETSAFAITRTSKDGLHSRCRR